MRTTSTIIFTVLLFRLSSQTVTPVDNFDPQTKTVGTSTLLTCREMKPNCKPGKLETNRVVSIDTTICALSGFVMDMTGKTLSRVFFKLINQKTKESNFNMTDSTGRMRLSGISAGIYTLKLNAFGYQDLIIKDLKFNPGDVREIIADMGEYCCTKTEVKLENHDSPKTKTK